MSYRNPQIIVDRSAEIWAQGVTNIGKIVGQGLKTYFELKKKNEETQKKKDDAINTTMIQGDLKQSALRDKMAKTIKDVSLQEKFTKRAEFLANGDDETKGAIWYNTQLSLNPPTDKKTLKEYKDKVKQYQRYMANSAQEIGYVMSALETTKDLSAQQIVDNYAVAGQSGVSELQNLMAMRALENKALEGFDYEKDLIYNEDGTNSLKVVGYLDKNSKTYKAWEKTGVFKDQDLEYTKDGKVKISWERNLAKWGEDGQFVNEISPAIDMQSVMKDTGLINKNGFANDNLYVTPTVQQRLTNQDGTSSITTEKVLDYNKLHNNSAFKAEIKSKAAGIDARSENDQIDFIRNRFGWGDMKTEDFFNKSREQRLAFYEGQLEMEAIKKLGSFRNATKEDVKMLEDVMPGIEEGKPIIFQEIKRQTVKPKIKTKAAKEPKESVNIANTYLEEFSEDPAIFFKRTFSTGEETDKFEDISYDEGMITVKLFNEDTKTFAPLSLEAERLLKDIVESKISTAKKREEVISQIESYFKAERKKTGENSFTKSMEKPDRFGQYLME